jgi:hypothetical protein
MWRYFFVLGLLLTLAISTAVGQTTQIEIGNGPTGPTPDEKQVQLKFNEAVKALRSDVDRAKPSIVDAEYKFAAKSALDACIYHFTDRMRAIPLDGMIEYARRLTMITALEMHDASVSTKQYADGIFGRAQVFIASLEKADSTLFISPMAMSLPQNGAILRLSTLQSAYPHSLDGITVDLGIAVEDLNHQGLSVVTDQSFSRFPRGVYIYTIVMKSGSSDSSTIDLVNGDAKNIKCSETMTRIVCSSD